MIKDSHFQKVFRDLKIKGFETTSLLTWSFFFFSKKKSNLQQVINELDGHNYNTEILKFDNADYKLVANKVEILTSEKLEKRNIAFSQLADYCDVLFDGWEVSK